MDAFIRIFLELLHYVPYIKDEKVKLQELLPFIATYFKDIIELYSVNTLRMPYTKKGSVMDTINI